MLTIIITIKINCVNGLGLRFLLLSFFFNRRAEKARQLSIAQLALALHIALTIIIYMLFV